MRATYLLADFGCGADTDNRLQRSLCASIPTEQSHRPLCDHRRHTLRQNGTNLCTPRLIAKEENYDENRIGTRTGTSKHLFRYKRNEKFGLPDEAENPLHQMMLHTKEDFRAKQLLRRLPSTWILSIRGRVVLLSRPTYQFPQANSRRSRTSSPGQPSGPPVRGG